MVKKERIIIGTLLIVSIAVLAYVFTIYGINTTGRAFYDEVPFFEDKFLDQQHISATNQIVIGANDDGIDQWAKLTLLGRKINEYKSSGGEGIFEKYNNGAPVRSSAGAIKSCINQKRINPNSDYEWYCYVTKRVDNVDNIGITKTNDFINWHDEGDIIYTSCDPTFNEPVNPKVIYWNDTYLLYATTRLPRGYGTHICLYTSEDGYSFTPHGSVYNGGEVIVKAVPIIINGVVYLGYEHQSGCGGAINCNYLLKSSDGGHNFTQVGKILPTGAEGQWDDDHVVIRQLIKIEDKLWQFYTGEYPSEWTDSNTGAAVGIAYSETGALTDENKFNTVSAWTKGNNPILRPDKSDWDDSSTYLGDVVYHNGLMHIISSSMNKDGESGDNLATLKFNHATSGNLTSTIITLPQGRTWKTFDASVDKPIGTNISFSILDAFDNSILLSKLDGNNNDISSITNQNIKLLAEFTTTNTNETPILKEWRVFIL